MGNIGFPELVVIVIAILILFGPGKLPEVGKAMGKAMGEFRKALRDGMNPEDSSSDQSKRPSK
jgi:TatA/E family protein of Tat protein translocase